MFIEKKEVLRYLGYGGHAPDARTDSLICELSAQLSATIEPQSVWRKIPFTLSGGGICHLNGIRIKSSLICRYLSPCEEAVLLAATLGLEADRYLHRYQRLEISKAAIWQAVASTALEAYCTEMESVFLSSFHGEKKYLRRSIAPGYGDFPLECQGELLRFLQADKKLGIVLTDGGLMQPEKSVIVLYGLSSSPVEGKNSKCAACDNYGCAYRETT